MTRRVLAGLAAACLAAAVFIATVGAEPARAANLHAVGWWWKANPGQRVEPTGPAPAVGLPQPAPAPPAPPTVPEDGLFVGRDADGATGMGAVRFTLTSSEASPVLTLKVANSSQNAGKADILACETGSAWTAQAAGRWDSKPLVACDAGGTGGGSVSGVPSEDGATWTFALSPLLIDGPGGREIDVALVPAVDADAPAGAQEPFQVTFEKVEDGSLETQDEFEADESFGGGGFDSGAFSGGGSAGGEMEAGFAPGASFTPSGDPGARLAGPALPEAEQGMSATAPRTRNRTAPNRARNAATRSDDAEPIAIGLILAGGLFAYWAARKGTTGGRLAGAAAGSAMVSGGEAETLGGLGRFVRPRSGPPPKLS